MASASARSVPAPTMIGTIGTAPTVACRNGNSTSRQCSRSWARAGPANSGDLASAATAARSTGISPSGVANAVIPGAGRAPPLKSAWCDGPSRITRVSFAPASAANALPAVAPENTYPAWGAISATGGPPAAAPDRR